MWLHVQVAVDSWLDEKFFVQKSQSSSSFALFRYPLASTILSDKNMSLQLFLAALTRL